MHIYADIDITHCSKIANHAWG